MVMEAPAEKPRRRGKRAYIILAVIAVAVAGGWLGHRWLTRGEQKTDDAQVEADVVPVSSRVAGTLKTAKVSGGQEVHAGDVLFEIDPESFDLEVARAEGELDAALAQEKAAAAQVAIVKSTSHGGLSSAKAAATGASASARGAEDVIRAAEAAVARAKADLSVAETELGRTTELVNKGAVTRRDLDLATQTRDVARAALQSATAQLESARASRSQAIARVAEAQGRVAQSTPVDQQIAAAEAAAQLASGRVKSATAALAKAKLDRTHTVITAPIGGIVSKRGVQVGQTVKADQVVVMIVPNETYVVANFKETQIAQMHPGDRVDIELDAYDGELSGVVDSISPATGSRFSLLPPDNATGNFVKVVQRVPVKINWKTPPKMALRPGLSAEVVVHTN
jgi:membrane fusion protein (multidrug efflux system)